MRRRSPRSNEQRHAGKPCDHHSEGVRGRRLGAQRPRLILDLEIVGSSKSVQVVSCAKERGVHVMIAVLGGRNEGSEALHRRCGFERVGRLAEVGWKFGEWVDTTYMARRL